MVPLAYSFSSSRLLMLYLLDTVHAQDCSGACLRRKLYTSKGISAKRAHTHTHIYIYILCTKQITLACPRVRRTGYRSRSR